METKQLKPDVRQRIIRKALMIRETEQRLLDLYKRNKVSGTMHTCTGQEFSGAVISEFIEPGDSVFSNHRCHGHFLSIHDDVFGLISEIMGKKSGLCEGRGGSQHLCKESFYSNGIQGGTTPIACGLAFARKMNAQKKISVVFIGDGTLGEGVVYEVLNIAAKWELPLLIVLENNGWSQSTQQEETLAGDIRARAESFGIKSVKTQTWRWEELYHESQSIVNYVRQNSKPAFLQIDTFRLGAHSTKDDDRSPELIDHYKSIDPLNILLEQKEPEIIDLKERVNQEVDSAVAEAEREQTAEMPEHFNYDFTTRLEWSKKVPSKGRVINALNQVFRELLHKEPKALFLGEDVRSPYGGAFKVSQSLSDDFPDRVINTPISEAAIVGIGAGLAMEGYLPIVEIMFGDFITLALDQIINHISKFRFMYNEQVKLDMAIRTPMGGGRGYGPTHSQTLDRHVFGIPGLRVVAINNLIDPADVYKHCFEKGAGPTLMIENKKLYTEYLCDEPPEGFDINLSNESFPTAWVAPKTNEVDVTLIGYGGMSSVLLKVAENLLMDHDIIAQVICPTQIYPFKLDPFMGILERSLMVAIVEEGQIFAGFGAECIAQMLERHPQSVPKVIRYGPKETPIPAALDMEKEALPNVDGLVARIVTDLSAYTAHGTEMEKIIGLTTNSGQTYTTRAN